MDMMMKSIFFSFPFCFLPLIKVKPEFGSESMVSFELVEGNEASINLTARGNPANIKYKWHRISGNNGLDSTRFITEGPVFNITSVLRQDSGSYLIEATNSQGTTKLPFTLNVKCEYQKKWKIHPPCISTSFTFSRSIFPPSLYITEQFISKLNSIMHLPLITFTMKIIIDILDLSLLLITFFLHDIHNQFVQK